MSQIRYLIDEDTPHAIRRGLLRLQPDIDIRVVGGEMAPPLSTPDPDILDWLEREGYILVTRNWSTMPRHLRDHLNAGKHVPGILVAPPNVQIGGIIDDLLLIWEAARPQEYQDSIEYLPL